ncbi:hypothetical protein LIA77_07881 [Sarocladium implicatum]|nr:hypothetical protein LIA77_07881 [Sarocladium implicatum]
MGRRRLATSSCTSRMLLTSRVGPCARVLVLIERVGSFLLYLSVAWFLVEVRHGFVRPHVKLNVARRAMRRIQSSSAILASVGFLDWVACRSWYHCIASGKRELQTLFSNNQSTPEEGEEEGN